MLSGIGQVVKRYAQIFEDFSSRHIILGEDVPEECKKEYLKFAFVLPIQEHVIHIKEKYDPDIVMTVCETIPVHEIYRIIFDTFKDKLILTPSQFCSDIFHDQFGIRAHVFPHGAKFPSLPRPIQPNRVYTFYTIGNMLDPRKNLRMLLEAFLRCNFPHGTVRLVIKSTAIKDIEVRLPHVQIINGLMSEEELEKVHEMCDCYINCSHSEGVGMGAVEAALRDKPVIITDFGGLKEYVKTPFTVPCDSVREMGFSEFLFEPHMKWGFPSMEKLIEYMKHCHSHNIRTWNHAHTRDFTSRSMLHTKLSEYLRLTFTRSPIEVPRLTDESDGWLLV